MRNTNVKIDGENLHTSSEILRALAHPLRMQILEFIDEHKSINVNKIYNTLKLEQSITSQHLRILRKADIVTTSREGKFIHYSVNYDKIAHVVNSINNFLEKEEEE
ncbi:MAG: ArsR/SmtB family transcription factor [Saprospiraceae bacterium]